MLNTKRNIGNLLNWTEKKFKTDTRYLVKGGFWITVGQIVSSLSAFILSIVYANWLPQETYGIYKYVLSMMSILSIPTLNGMGTAVTQAVALGKEGSVRLAIKVKIKWGLIGSIGSFALSGYYYLAGNNTLFGAFILVGLFIPIVETFGIYDNLFHGRKEFKRSVIFYIIGQISATSVILITLYFNQTVGFILAAYFTTWTLVRAILLKYSLAKYQPNKLTDKDTIAYGKHLTAINAFNTLANYLDKILLFHFAGATTLAIYSITQAPLDQVRSLVSRGISTLAFPKYALKKSADLSKHIDLWILRSIFGLTLVSISYIVFIPWIFPLVFPVYAKDVWYSQLAALGLIPLVSFIPFTALNAKAMKKELYYYNLSSATFQIVSICSLGYMFGLIGVIISRILSRFFDLTISWLLVKNNLKKVTLT